MSKGLQSRQQLNQLHEEEELLTPYESKDSHASGATSKIEKIVPKKEPHLSGWEFKIVRANKNLFRDPAIFRRLCEEEAQAGWILLEKFDDCRVRFKRPAAVREMLNPELLTFDPYRTHYGASNQSAKFWVPVAFLIATLLPAYLAYTLVVNTLQASRSNTPVSSPSPNTVAPANSLDLRTLPDLNKRRLSPDKQASPTPVTSDRDSY
ncbi:MAG TPA: hypothetical protein IGS53_18925 [Leptolyngbyaceae cyanobacterium M33_DOE_097]|uniref:Uncharacterized protein n=1 Tax=Oscillatoriales cyanobacterium SpSt-418 TaxID=2282169 RepID=A0A7C3KF60_9CYAN|nr:hypothetical protein [Leptolyngbyaceae cyanobacterium M33_DOE_097]